MLLTRPTAVNIKWAVERIKRFLKERRGESVTRLKELLIEEAKRYMRKTLRLIRQ